MHERFDGWVRVLCGGTYLLAAGSLMVTLTLREEQTP
jgi:hypothetical protein